MKKRLSIGSSRSAAKYYFALGFIVSAILNITGIARLIDVYVEWAGIFKRIIVAYEYLIIQPINYFFSQIINFFGFSFSIPDWLLAYVSLCVTFGPMFTFLCKFLGMQTEGSQDSLSNVGTMSLIPMTIHFSKVMYGLCKQPYSSVLIRIFVVVFNLATLPVVVVGLFLFSSFIILPWVIFRNTIESILMFFVHDFNKVAEDEKEEVYLKRKQAVYTSTFLFWVLIASIVVFLGVMIKFNDAIRSICSDNNNKNYEHICE